MFNTTAKTIPIDPNNRSEHIGICISRGGLVTLDEYFTIDPSNPVTPPSLNHPFEVAKFITVATAGNLVFQYFDKTYDYFIGAVPGFFYPFSAIRIVTSHNFTNGGLITTSATGLHWYGGV